MIDMFHPKLDVTVSVTQNAFDRVWSKRGWIIDTPPVQEQEEVVSRPLSFLVGDTGPEKFQPSDKGEE